MLHNVAPTGVELMRKSLKGGMVQLVPTVNTVAVASGNARSDRWWNGAIITAAAPPTQQPSLLLLLQRFIGINLGFFFNPKYSFLYFFMKNISS